MYHYTKFQPLPLQELKIYKGKENLMNMCTHDPGLNHRLERQNNCKGSYWDSWHHLNLQFELDDGSISLDFQVDFHPVNI